VRPEAEALERGGRRGTPPPGSRNSPTSPKTPWGRLNFERASADSGLRRECPPPAPAHTNYVRRGKTFDCGTKPIEALQTRGSHNPSPEFGGGVDGCCEERAKKPSGERAASRSGGVPSRRSPPLTPVPAPHLNPPPGVLGEGGRVMRARVGAHRGVGGASQPTVTPNLRFSLPHAVCGAGRGGGRRRGAPHPLERFAASRRAVRPISRWRQPTCTA
jgi:hypothetical protein